MKEHPTPQYPAEPCAITTHPCPECSRLTGRVILIERVASKAVRYYQATKTHAPYMERVELNKALEDAGY